MVEYIHKIGVRLPPDLFEFPRGLFRCELKNSEFGSFSTQVFVRLDASQATRGK
jgi:hypothetical protein